MILAARSVNLPLLWCGWAKPTYGLVSRFGLVACFIFDQIGPFGRTVEDAAIYCAIAGHDPKDSTSLKVDIPDYTQSLKPDLKSIRIGVIKETFGEGLELLNKLSIKRLSS